MGFGFYLGGEIFFKLFAPVKNFYFFVFCIQYYVFCMVYNATQTSEAAEGGDLLIFCRAQRIFRLNFSFEILFDGHLPIPNKFSP